MWPRAPVSPRAFGLWQVNVFACKLVCMERGRGIFQFQGTEEARLDALPIPENPRDTHARAHTLNSAYSVMVLSDNGVASTYNSPLLLISRCFPTTAQLITRGDCLILGEQWDSNLWS